MHLLLHNLRQRTLTSGLDSKIEASVWRISVAIRINCILFHRWYGFERRGREYSILASLYWGPGLNCLPLYWLSWLRLLKRIHGHIRTSWKELWTLPLFLWEQGVLPLSMSWPWYVFPIRVVTLQSLTSTLDSAWLRIRKSDTVLHEPHNKWK